MPEEFDVLVVGAGPSGSTAARHAALNFLFPRAFQPLFGHNWVEVTREAAKDVANAFNSRPMNFASVPGRSTSAKC